MWSGKPVGPSFRNMPSLHKTPPPPTTLSPAGADHTYQSFIASKLMHIHPSNTSFMDQNESNGSLW